MAKGMGISMYGMKKPDVIPFSKQRTTWIATVYHG